jgi:hypothetical protein
VRIAGAPRYSAIQRAGAARAVSAACSWMQTVAAGWLVSDLPDSVSAVGVLVSLSRGADVSVHLEGYATTWEAEDASKVLMNPKTWLTYNGVTLVDQFAGRTVAIDVAPRGGATETVEVIETELRAKLKLANAKALTSDHGLLHYLVSFDANGEFLGIDVVRDRGGHPAFQATYGARRQRRHPGIPFPG